jgi:hypothetical protein
MVERRLRKAGTDKMLFAMVNIPWPAMSFSIYYKIIASAMADVSESSVMYAVEEAVAEN